MANRTEPMPSSRPNNRWSLSGRSIRTQLAVIGLLPLLAILPIVVRAATDDVRDWREARTEATTAERITTLTRLTQAVRSEWVAALDVTGLASSDVAEYSEVFAQRAAETMAEDGSVRFRRTSADVDEAAARSDTLSPDATERLATLADIRARVVGDQISPAEVDLFYSRLMRTLEEQLTVDVQTLTDLASVESRAAVDAQAVVGDFSRDAGLLRYELTIAVDRLLAGGRTDWGDVDDAVEALNESTERASGLQLASSPDWIEARRLALAAIDDVNRTAAAGPNPGNPNIRDLIDSLLDARADLAEAQEPIVATRSNLVAVIESAAAAERSSAQRSLLLSVSLVAMATTVLVFVIDRATRSIVNPLRRVASVARRVSEGEIPDDPVDDANGPAEVRAMASTLDDLVVTVGTIATQAEAVNRNDLDHPVLDRRLPGQLGRTLETSLGAWQETTRQLEHDLSHDRLTGLSSRHHLLRQTDELLAHGPVSVTMIALDRFKGINDTAGHQNGDQLLRQVAERLRSAVPDGWLLARVWSDEFVVAAPAMPIDEVTSIVQRLLTTVGTPIVLGRRSFQVRATAGIATGDDPVALLGQAALAVRHGKSLGGDRAVVHDDRFVALLDARAELEGELVSALADDRLELWYQPVLDLVDRRCIGAEALVRWPQADGSIRMPGEFIPLAEETGLIVDLDRWVLNEACRTLASWRGTDLDRLEIAVNISGRHLVDGDPVAAVAEAARRWSVDPGRLAIEITESYLADDIDRTRVVLQRLHELGPNLLIDDFGTGYSSLAYLQDLPFDVLKIDRAFVAPLEQDDASSSIVETLIRLGHDLGLRVLAEGLESEASIGVLTEMGCDQAQGYAIARPMPLDRLTSFVTGTLNPVP